MNENELKNHIASTHGASTLRSRPRNSIINLKPVCKSIWLDETCKIRDCPRAHPPRCSKPDCLILDKDGKFSNVMTGTLVKKARRKRKTIFPNLGIARQIIFNHLLVGDSQHTLPVINLVNLPGPRYLSGKNLLHLKINGSNLVIPLIHVGV